MSFLGVSIDCITPNAPKVSASGIKICDHFILTHCCVVWHLVKDCVKKNLSIIFVDKNFKSLQNILTQRILELNLKFSVVLPLEHSELTSKCVLGNGCSGNFENSSNLQWEKPPVLTKDAYVQQIIISPGLVFEFLNLLYESDQWKFDKSEEKEIKSNKYLENLYTSTFLILRTKKGGNIDGCFAQFEEITSGLRKGTTVFIDGCPFGFNSARAVFLNSLSKGIISNISHSGNIILTDARCIIGCEGAPAYSFEHRFCVCGIVISPFCWLKGEWIGLTFMASIKPLLTYIRSTLEPSNSVEMYPVAGCTLEPVLMSGGATTMFHIDDESLSCNPSSFIKEARLIPDVVNVIKKRIVRIVRKGSDDWGTGVVVAGTKGLVVTCAHVTRGAMNQMVNVVFWNGKNQTGVVIFESNAHLKESSQRSQQNSDFDVWDLAIVRLPFQPRHSLPLSKELPRVGTSVIIGGHPLFRAEALFTQTFSLGNLAKVSNVFRRSKTLFDGFEPQQQLPLHDKERTTSQWWENPSAGEASFRPLLNEGLVCPYWRRCSISNDSIPVALQTTCGVYNGVSGAPVVALHPGKGAVVIGIVSCCARDVDSKVSFPHVNIATPVFLLAEAVDHFSLTEDMTTFDPLKFKSPSSLEIWKLKNMSKSKL